MHDCEVADALARGRAVPQRLEEDRIEGRDPEHGDEVHAETGFTETHEDGGKRGGHREAQEEIDEPCARAGDGPREAQRDLGAFRQRYRSQRVDHALSMPALYARTVKMSR